MTLDDCVLYGRDRGYHAHLIVKHISCFISSIYLVCPQSNKDEGATLPMYCVLWCYWHGDGQSVAQGLKTTLLEALSFFILSTMNDARFSIPRFMAFLQINCNSWYSFNIVLIHYTHYLQCCCIRWILGWNCRTYTDLLYFKNMRIKLWVGYSSDLLKRHHQTLKWIIKAL